MSRKTFDHNGHLNWSLAMHYYGVNDRQFFCKKYVVTRRKIYVTFNLGKINVIFLNVEKKITFNLKIKKNIIG